MRRVLWLCVIVFVFLLPQTRPTRADDLVFGSFDAGPLTSSEKRLLQTALAATGDYRGPLDGAWGPLSRTAIEAYAEREFGGPALNAHAAALILGFVDEVGRDGWDFRYLPELGVSLALPLRKLGPPEAEEGGQRRWASDGTLTVLTHRFGTAAEVRAWHAASRHANADPDRLYAVTRPDLLATGGVLRDGRPFYTRSERTGTEWATVFLAADSEARGEMNLIASSIRRGPPQPWDLPEGGLLSALVSRTSALLENGGAGEAAIPTAAPAPRTTALPTTAEGISSTGTGFYLAARTVVTAQHVVAGCTRVTLADGRELGLVAADPELDVAILAAPGPSRTWLSLAPAGLRLGQRVHAAGFPYYSIAGTSLNLTSGNVSALAGVDDDRRFFTFSAPVQPGNSGGPLIDARGDVIGLVVARLSEDYIEETTGSLPQNVNYALGEDELEAFLSSNGIGAATGGLGAFDMDDGAPDGFDAAVVPIVCH